MFDTFAQSLQGESHKRNDKPCQDYSYAEEKPVYRNGRDYITAVAIVADGHGGERYFRSHDGSRLAGETAREEIYNFIESTAEKGIGFFEPNAPERDNKAHKNLRRLKKKIIDVWREKVFSHVKSNEWTKEEREFCDEKSIPIKDDEESLLHIYGTTLMAVLVAPNFWFALHIGDGGCVVVDKDVIPKMALEEDEEQRFGFVHSLCNKDAIRYFRHNFGFETILGAVAASDGITDSYSKENYLDFTVTNILKNFLEEPEESKEELVSNYLPTVSRKGSQDDVSLAVVFNIKESKERQSDILQQIAKIKKEHTAKEEEGCDQLLKQEQLCPKNEIALYSHQSGEAESCNEPPEQKI